MPHKSSHLVEDQHRTVLFKFRLYLKLANLKDYLLLSRAPEDEAGCRDPKFSLSWNL